MSIEDIRDILQAKYRDMDVLPIRHEDIVFEERVRLKCFHCRNYRAKWTCPGKLPSIDFRKLIGEYDHLAVIRYQKSDVSDQKSDVSGQIAEIEYKRAGNELHRAMLYLESELFKRGNPLAQSLIGGSCELCKDGCSPEACAHPEQARVPWDAAGCNVTRSLANIGITIDFTDTRHIARYGLLLW